jgi:hypothetical protein
MKKLTRIIVSAALALSALGIAAPSASALTCPPASDIAGDSHNTLYLILYEALHYVGGTSPDNETLCFYATTTGSLLVPNLKNIAYGAENEGVCDGQLLPSYGTWNDCESSLQAFSDCHHTIQLYNDAYYGQIAWSFTSSTNKDNLTDTISSVRITYHSSCIGSPSG